jgi:hypothetical protein
MIAVIAGDVIGSVDTVLTVARAWALLSGTLCEPVGRMMNAEADR